MGVALGFRVIQLHPRLPAAVLAHEENPDSKQTPSPQIPWVFAVGLNLGATSRR